MENLLKILLITTGGFAAISVVVIVAAKKAKVKISFKIDVKGGIIEFKISKEEKK